MFDRRILLPVLRTTTLNRATHRPRPHRRPWARISAGLALLTALAAQAALATTMTITPYPNPGVAGEELTYHVQVNQPTGTPCSNVTIRLNLPSGVTFRSSRPGGSHSGGQVTWTRSRLHNETVSYWAVVDVDPGLANGTPLNASGSVSGSNCGTQTSITSPVLPGGAPNLTLSKSASRSHIDAGGQFTYTLTYANTGNADATGVRVFLAGGAGGPREPDCDATGHRPEGDEREPDRREDAVHRPGDRAALHHAHGGKDRE